MKKYLLFMVLLGAGEALWAQTPDANNTIYVKSGANGNGSSWASPIGELADALKYAKAHYTDLNLMSPSKPLKIYVAKGTYSPKYSGDNVDASGNVEDYTFRLHRNLYVFGGFDPDNGIKEVWQRKTFDNTILFAKNNMRHVVILTGDNEENVILDGFKITGGYAYGNGNYGVNGESIGRHRGGGLFVDQSRMLMRNCTITANKSKGGGAAIFVEGNNNPRLTVVNTLIYKNESSEQGSGLSVNEDAQAKLINCTLAFNKSTANQSDNGGVIDSESNGTDQRVYVYNSIIFENYKRVNDNDPTWVVNFTRGNSTIYGEVKNNVYNGPDITYTGASANIKDEPKFKNSNGDDYSLQDVSPAIDKGNNSYYSFLGSDKNKNLDAYGSYRFINNTIDIGASEFIKFSPNNGIIYVKKGSTGNGSSWSNAIGEVSDALKGAANYRKNNSVAIQIWVAGGNYKPQYSAIDGDMLGGDGIDTRYRSFVMLKDVKLFGGFAGNESNINERDLSKTSNASILNGDIDGNDNVSGSAATLNIANNGENSMHVVISAGNIGNAELNGFTVQRGNAGEVIEGYKTNGIYIYNYGGGGLYIDESDLKVGQSKILENAAHFSGGGIYLGASNSKILNSFFYKNLASNRGGAVANIGTPIFSNCTISGNKAPNQPDIRNDNSVKLKFYNGIIDNNSMGFDILANIDYQSCYVDAIGFSNYFPRFKDRANGDYTLLPNSSLIDDGDNSLYPEVLTNELDINGKKRLDGLGIDIGTYETQLVALPNPLYVNKNVSGGTGDGSSWTNAIKDLSKAMLMANTNRVKYTNAPPLQIWVAKGTYVPTISGDDEHYGTDQGRKNAFVLGDNINLYGGFLGGETSIDQRPPFSTANRTILSGDRNGDDVYDNSSNSSIGNTAQNISDNIRNILIISKDFHSSANEQGNTVIDGIEIKGGNANDLSANMYLVNNVSIFPSSGGGITHSSKYNDNLVLKNISVNNNYAKIDAALKVYGNNNIKLSLENSHVFNNTGDSQIAGGSIKSEKDLIAKVSNSSFNKNSGSRALSLVGKNTKVTVSNSLFSKNSAQPFLVNNYDNTGINQASVTNSTIVDNIDGAGLYFANGATTSSLKLYNNIIYGNGGAIYLGNNVNYSLDYKNNLIQGETDTSNGNIDGNTDPMFTDPANGDYSLMQNSPVINKGNNSLYTSSGGNLSNDKDLAGNARLIGTTIDLGAYEASTGTLDTNNVETKKLNIYPNPVNDILNITGADNAQSIKVYNMAGQLVMDMKFASQINLSKLTSGSYILRITDKDGQLKEVKILKK